MHWVVRVLAGLLLVVVVAAAGIYVWLRQSLPEEAGEVSVAGLTAPVEIVRDSEGVPHIYAQSEADAYFGLGFVHAQDRLWQMEISRRIGAGRMSEIFGEPTLEIDRFLRTLGLYRAAERTLPNLSAATNAALAAYATGVNAFLAANAAPLPPEFVVLGHTPEPWRPADSVVWIKMMAFNLSANLFQELLRAELAKSLTAQEIVEFLPDYPQAQLAALTRFRSLYDGLPLTELAGVVGALRDPANGSNNWVVAGSRTESGKPLLANDPHLGLGAPAIWYFAHLQAPGLNVIGATLPGVPVVVLGRNDHIAWGFTNTGPDTQDLFIERITPGQDGHYDSPEGPLPFLTREEVIAVSGGESVTMRVRETRHGPVLSDSYERAAGVAPAGFVLALQWTALRDDDRTLQAGIAIAKAENWDGFLAAAQDFHAPQQSIVYADTAGNIGMYAPARVPIRKPENTVRGLMPVPGWDAAYDWQGFIPYDALPKVFNPPSGMIYTANHKIVGDDYPYFITYEWEPPYRARRIGELLAARDKHSVASLAAIQGDIVSRAATDLLPLLLAASPDGAAARPALERLAIWDGTMAADRPEPLILAAWLRELTRLIYADDLGTLFADNWAIRAPFLTNVLSRQQHWCDDRNTEAVEPCGDRIAQALTHALDDLADRHGKDLDDWQWGEEHPAVSEHRPFSRVPLLRQLFEIRLPAPGGEYTVNRGGFNIADGDSPFAMVHGASLRAIYDLADLERSLFMHSTGQSGHVLSPLYRNFAKRWRDVAYVPMQTARDAVDATARGTLRLIPASPG
ncbi:MAG: penicillin acylase family protein [Alphaproteobacteria bacterium]|nr:penicillin acylase family protein [Alphaproteobacteria bacterium]